MTVSTFKFLGITVDRNLTWKNHIDDLAKSVLVVLVFYIKLNNFFQKVLF